MNKDAEIELKHILLELHNNRSQHLRHFVDQYFCYKNGYVNKNGKAKWDLIFWKEYVSSNAEKLTDKKLIIKEHVVPLKVISEKLKELGPECSIEEVENLIDKYLHFATITKEEDMLLREFGLNHKMPDDFFDVNSELYMNIFARYIKVGIKYKKIVLK